MLYWAFVFLIVALLAGVFGFGFIATSAMGFAKILFFLFIVMALVSAIAGLARRGSV